MIGIPSSETIEIPATQAVTYDRWGIVSQSVNVDASGRIAFSATICRANETEFSPDPSHRLDIADPDFQRTAAGDATLGPLLTQRVGIDLAIARRILEMRELI